MIKILRFLDVSDYIWCRDAVLIQITGGKSALTHVAGNETEDYTVKSVLSLNGKPLVQEECPI